MRRKSDVRKNRLSQFELKSSVPSRVTLLVTCIHPLISYGTVLPSASLVDSIFSFNTSVSLIRRLHLWSASVCDDWS